jgi:hypothetical protein
VYLPAALIGSGISIAVTDRRQALHDLACGTMVVRRTTPPDARDLFYLSTLSNFPFNRVPGHLYPATPPAPGAPT